MEFKERGTALRHEAGWSLGTERQVTRPQDKLAKRNQKDMSDTEIYIVAAKDFLCDQLT